MTRPTIWLELRMWISPYLNCLYQVQLMVFINNFWSVTYCHWFISFRKPLILNVYPVEVRSVLNVVYISACLLYNVCTPPSSCPLALKCMLIWNISTLWVKLLNRQFSFQICILSIILKYVTSTNVIYSILHLFEGFSLSLWHNLSNMPVPVCSSLV